MILRVDFLDEKNRVDCSIDDLRLNLRFGQLVSRDIVETVDEVLNL